MTTTTAPSSTVPHIDADIDLFEAPGRDGCPAFGIIGRLDRLAELDTDTRIRRLEAQALELRGIVRDLASALALAAIPLRILEHPDDFTPDDDTRSYDEALHETLLSAASTLTRAAAVEHDLNPTLPA